MESNKRKDKKIKEVTIIKNYWNDSDTIKFIGQVGKIIEQHDFSFVDVLIGKKLITFHKDEINYK